MPQYAKYCENATLLEIACCGSYVPVHEISVFIAYAQNRPLNAHTDVFSNVLVEAFIYIQTIFMLKTWRDSPGYSLLNNAISACTIISCADPVILFQNLI